VESGVTTQGLDGLAWMGLPAGAMKVKTSGQRGTGGSDLQGTLSAFRARIFAALSLLPAMVGCSSDVTTESQAPSCDGAAPFIAAGMDSGYVQCKGGWFHRPEVKTCGSTLPRAVMCTDPNAMTSTCKTDSDCQEKPNGFCLDTPWVGCGCAYGCTTDADCAPGAMCMCGDPVGTCVATTGCKKDADCGPGLRCATYTDNPGCGGLAFACQTTDDKCTGDGDCPSGQMCTLQNGHRECVTPQCAIGRPFLVAGKARTAPLAGREDWRQEGLAPDLARLSPAEREVLAAYWAEVGQMEHASIAAFARFVLEMMSMGAPPDLVMAAQGAMADETAHVRMAFGLASAYGGRPLGPGSLSLDGALAGRDARAVVMTAIAEACVGETVAALEALEALAHAEDEAVRSVLSTVAADEARHAELGWRFVQWAIERNPSLHAAAVEGFARALSEAPAGVGEDQEEPLLHAGLLGEARKRALRRRAIGEVVRPCARSLLAAARPGARLCTPAEA
jgi:hypothetical protein